VQLIFSGKPHPEDPQGKALFEEVAAFSEAPGLRGRVVLLEDYDPEVARCLVRGVDVWLNNPRRPLEASGTSGQKVPVNCGLNLSILDGWWCEGYAPEVGWCFGEPRDYEDPARQDEDDHAALLDVLEKEVVPLYYRRDRRGVPREWMRRVRAAIERLVPRFSTHHMVSQYVEQLYRPALENGSVVAESGFALARELAAWTEKVKRCWPLVHVRSASWLKPGRQGTVMAVDAYLDGLLPEDFVCLDERGGVLAILKAERAGDATRFEIEASRRPRRGAPSSYRLLPSHPEMVHLQELGLSCRFIL
jgi:starch phosphorylase